jgi:hypothetical protein
MTQCLAGWLKEWERADAVLRAKAEADGEPPPALIRYKGKRPSIRYKGKRPSNVKKAMRELATELGLLGTLSPKTFRNFMSDQTHKLFPRLPDKLRSRWIGHVTKDGSRTTTTHYQGNNPRELIDVAIATDAIIALLDDRCERSLFAVKPQRPPPCSQKP